MTPFGKYIIEDPPRVLGLEAGYRFEISDQVNQRYTYNR